MHKSILRPMVVLMVVMFIFTSFAACGGSNQSPTDNAPATTGGQAAVTIEFWDPDNRVDWIKSTDKIFADILAEKNITVKRVNVPYADYDTKVQASAATKTLPDMLETFYGYCTDWAYQGKIIPVDDVIEKVGKDRFNEAQLMYARLDGKVYGVPYYIYPHVVTYRKDWYAEKGLKVPTTWQEMYDNAKALDGVVDGQRRYGFLFYNKNPEPHMFIDLLACNGASEFDKDLNVTINSPETIEALVYAKKLFEFSPKDALIKSMTDQRMAFVQGLGAHIISSTSIASSLAKDPTLAEKVGSFPLPINHGDRGAIAEFITLAITNTSKNQEAAKELIQFMLRDDEYLYFASNTVLGHLPVVKMSAESEKKYLENERGLPYAETFQAGLKVAESGIMMGQRNGPNKYSGQIMTRKVWGTMAEMVLLQNKTPEEAAKWAEEQIKQIVKDNE